MRVVLVALLLIACASPDATMTTLYADGLASWWVRPLWTEQGGYLFGSVVADAGKVLALKVDIGDLSVTTFELGDHEEDDHNAAAHVVPTDQPPLYFWARHGQDTSLRYRIGSGAAGALAFGAAQAITFAGNVTYAQAWRRPGTDEVHVFVRDSARYWSNVYSSGWGTGWSSPRRVFDGGSGENDLYYIATIPTAADPSIVRVAAYGHPYRNAVHDIYAGLIDLDTGVITNLAGTTLGNLKTGTGLPIAISSLSLAVDTDSGYTVRMFDVSDGDDFAVVYSHWLDGSNAGSTYRLATYNGSTWDVEDITASGVPFGAIGIGNYFGGVSFPRPDPGAVLYLARESSGTWYVEKWTKDGTWSGEQLATDSEFLVRPWTVERGSSVQAVWHRVTAYTDETWVFTASVEALQRREVPSSLAGSHSAWPSFRP